MPDGGSVSLSPRDVHGLWMQEIDEAPDPALGDPATHGTYTQSIYLQLVMGPSADNAGASEADADFQVLYVFDRGGDFARFEWQADRAVPGGRTGAWVSSNQAVTFSGDAVSLGKEMSITVAPNLALRAPSDPAVPASFKKVGCPMPFGTPTMDRPLKPDEGTDHTPAGGLNAGMPVEYIAEHPDDPHTLSWHQCDNTGTEVLQIDLAPADVMPRNPASDPADSWGDVFKSMTYALNDMVFVGYIPENIDLYSGDPTGTHAELWDDQSMSGPRLFAYPLRSSADFAKSAGAEGKYLPLGTIYKSINTDTENSFDLTISTENEHCTTMASTYGLNGGIKGMFKASLSESQTQKNQQTTSTQYRYTLSTDTNKGYALLAHPPNLSFDTDYANALNDKLDSLLGSPDLSISDLDWNAMEARWGSHYANAVTFGGIKTLKTTIREQAEGYLSEKSLSLSATAKGAYGKFSAGGDASVDNTWGDQFSQSITKEDVSSRFVGVDQPQPIFLDLRAASELLNPLLLPWDPSPVADRAEVRAPFMWYLLGSNWRAYQLKVHHLDANISALPDVDWSPKIVRILIVNLDATVQSAFDWPSMYGDCTWSVYGAATMAQGATYHRERDSAARSGNGDPIPGSENLSCLLVAPSAAYGTAGAVFHIQLWNWHNSDQNDAAAYDAHFPMATSPTLENQAVINSNENTYYLNLVWKVEAVPPSV
jgi:hypothetical protein